MSHRVTAQTRKQVSALLGFGCTDEQIATVLGIALGELRKLYSAELGHSGRPPHQPDKKSRGLVEAMASHGVPEEDIAKVLGIDEKTLRKHYERELETAATRANALVAQNLFTIARGKGREAVTAAIFWLKVRAGWRDHNPAAAAPPAKPPALGKKEAATAAAKTAADGTEWSELVDGTPN